MQKNIWQNLWLVSEIPIYAILLWNVVSVVLVGFLGIEVSSAGMIN